MEKKSDRAAPAFTVRQLSELFGKSEDTIRRWKNEGIGKGEDNVKLSAMENEDSQGRRTSRHLVFTRSAVRDFVQANPFLMDDAPQLREFMETPVKKPEVFALPDSIEDSRRRLAWQDAEDTWEEPEDDDAFLRRFTKCVEDELDSDNDHKNGSFFDRLRQRLDETGEDDEDPFLRFTRSYKPGTWEEDENGNPFISRQRTGEQEPGEEESDIPPRGHGERRSAEDEEAGSARRHRRPDSDGSINYILSLLRCKEADCRRELGSARSARSIMLRRRDIAEALPDRGSYIEELVREREEQLMEELENIEQTMRTLERMRWN